jgi:NAD(P)-dependent dehydrogenase (short-subunit alcohol dehydrogenase family)
MPKAVLITGTSSGLGLEMAVHLAERGFKVYASMRNLARRHALDTEAARRNVTLEVLQLDVTDRESIARAVQAVVAGSGGLYGLVNNAGIMVRGYFEDLSESEIRRVFETNVFGTMAVTRAVLPHMRAARHGRIILITSVGGRIGSLAVSPYCTAKFALEGFGESLAQEVLPFGIYVSLVEPAIIRTPFWERNRGVAKGALDAESPYYDWFRKEERLADRLVETTPTKPVHVARAVHRALTARRPRLRYLVGRRAGTLIALRRYVPGDFVERLYSREAVRRVTGARHLSGEG